MKNISSAQSQCQASGVIDVNRNGSEIAQDLKLRIAPITGTVRVLPFGRSRPVQPYLGAGIAGVAYRYSEVGDFVDFTDRSVFADRFVAKGTAVGPVVLGGLRFALGDQRALGGEVRYQKAEADLSDDFLGSKLPDDAEHPILTIRDGGRGRARRAGVYFSGSARPSR
jgi:opacity protein-like surface antigen